MSLLQALSPADAMVVGLLAVAVYTDLRSRRVPNSLTFGAMGVALAVHIVLGLVHGGREGLLPALLTWLLGILAAFIPGFLLWRLGGALKAGDAKLLMAIGAILGPLELLRVLLFTLIVEIPVGLAQLTASGRLRSFFSVVKAGVTRDADGPKPLMTPFAGVIALGYLASRFLPQVFRFWS